MPQNFKFQDLKHCLLSFNDLNYIKPKGLDGRFSVDGKRNNNNSYTEIDANYISSDTSVLSEWNVENENIFIDFNKLKINNILDITTSLVKVDDIFDVKIKGDNLNYSIIKDLLKNKIFKDRVKFTFDLKKLILTKKYHMTDVIGVADLNKNFEGSFNGKLNGKEDISINFVKPRDKQAQFTVKSDDAGSIFRVLKAYENGYNGDFFLMAN